MIGILLAVTLAVTPTSPPAERPKRETAEFRRGHCAGELEEAKTMVLYSQRLKALVDGLVKDQILAGQLRTAMDAYAPDLTPCDPKTGLETPFNDEP
jgi:hypothetical protein